MVQSFVLTLSESLGRLLVRAPVDIPCSDIVVFKGQNPAVDSYSAFFDNDHAVKTDLDRLLKERGVTSIYVCGLSLQVFCDPLRSVRTQDLPPTTASVTLRATGVSWATKPTSLKISRGASPQSQSHRLWKPCELRVFTSSLPPKSIKTSPFLLVQTCK